MSEIESAASALAQARAEAAKAAEYLDRAKAAQARVQERVDALGAERSGIVTASQKRAGDAHAALRLATIDADLADLGPAVAEQVQAVAIARGQADASNAAVVRAQQMLDMSADSQLLGKLTAHANRLDELLCKTLVEIAAIDKRTGRRPSWAPSSEVYAALTKLHLTANGIRR
jgi:hypothetical protein